MRGLYAIVDLDALSKRGLDPIAFACALLAARPAALQLRAKTAADADVVALLRALRPLCAAANVPLVANDRPDFALVAKTDMLHIGQGDASPSFVRTIAPGLALGISTHTPEQLNAALETIPAYVAFGPVWPTSSKDQPDPVVGVGGLRQAAQLIRHNARESGYAPPLVAIGGVTLARVAEITSYVAAAAVIGDLLPPRDLEGEVAYAYVRARAEQYQNAFAEPVDLEHALGARA